MTAATLDDVVAAVEARQLPRALPVAEVAKALHVSETTVRRLIRDGKLPTVPHLHNLSRPVVRVGVSALDDFCRGRSS